MRVTFTFDGREVEAQAGQTIAAALLAGGERTLRTTRHEARPRGLFCGIGACWDCLVVRNGRPGVRACLQAVADGDVIETQRGAGPDRVAAVSASGVRERGSAVAGAQELHARAIATPATGPARRTRSDADVVVIGGGPAGLAAALAAAGAGRSVLLLDDGPALGGQYHRQRAAELGPAAPVGAIAEVQAHPGIEVRCDTRVWRIDTGQLHTVRVAGRPDVRAPALVLAPGAHDRPLPFPGWDLPGVMTAGGAQALLKRSGVLPGRRVLVAGTGPFLLAVAAGIVRAGGTVAGVLELRADVAAAWARRPVAAAVAGLAGKGGEGLGYLATLRRARVPLRAGWRPLAARPGPDGAVAEVDVGPVTSADGPRGRGAALPGGDRPPRANGTSAGGWRGPQSAAGGRALTLAVDAIAAGYGFTPALELPAAAGCRLAAGGQAVEVDADGRTSVPGVLVAGEATGIGGADLAAVEGTIAGLGAAGAPVPAALRLRRRALTRFADALDAVHGVDGSWAADVPDDAVVCRCEEVTAGAVRHAVTHLGAEDARSVKLLCRAGMGLCQGRMCAANVEAIAGSRLGRPVPDGGGLAARPFAGPVTLGELARAEGA